MPMPAFVTTPAADDRRCAQDAGDAVLHRAARASLAFNRWARDRLSVGNSMIALDVLLGIYLSQDRDGRLATFKELGATMRHSEQAIRNAVDRLKRLGLVSIESDTGYGRAVMRLRLSDRAIALVRAGLHAAYAAPPPACRQPRHEAGT